MSNLLTEARTKTITKKLFDNILTELNGNNVTGLSSKWWETNKVEIIGLTVTEAISIFNAAKKRKNLSAKYDELVASMTWAEKLFFMHVGVKELKESNSKKIRTVALIGALAQASPKIISAILMVI